MARLRRLLRAEQRSADPGTATDVSRNRSMRILILHSRYLSGPASGENRVVEDEARVLREGGHQVDVFAPHVRDIEGWRLIRTAAETIWSRRAAEETARRVNDGRPDIVHAHNLFPALSPAVLRVVRGRAPIVLTLHNYRLLCLPSTFVRDGRVCEDCLGRQPWPGIIHGCYQGSVPGSAVLAASRVLHEAIGSFGQVSLYIAISKFVGEKHVDAGFPPDRIFVKPHFAWRSVRRDGAGDYFLYLGRLSPEKGVHSLLSMWRDIDQKLVVVGDGPDRERLRTIAPPTVEFRDVVAPDLVPELLLRARALLIPSITHEGAGKVALEAYAAGVPVVASRMGGLPEVVKDGVSGYLLPPGDAVSWRQAVARLLDDGVSRQLGHAAWDAWNASYSPRQGLGGLEEAYRRAMALASPDR